MFRILRHPGAALRHHLKTRTRGQSLVELALILPVFMLFFAAVLDLGRIAAAQIAVQNAAREGAFQAARTPTDFDSTTGCPAGAATNVIYCRIKLESSGGVSIAPTDVDVQCQPTSCNTGIGNTVTVRVTGHFRLLTPLMGVFFGGNQNVTFTGQSVQNIETLPEDNPNPGATPTPTATATSTATSTATATATATSTTTTCIEPSAGFTYTVAGSNSHHPPQTITVTDTSSSPNCGIDTWTWNWGDGTSNDGKVPGPHTYTAANKDGSGYFIVTLTVRNAAGSNTSGAVAIQVK